MLLMAGVALEFSKNAYMCVCVCVCVANALHQTGIPVLTGFPRYAEALLPTV